MRDMRMSLSSFASRSSRSAFTIFLPLVSHLGASVPLESSLSSCPYGTELKKSTQNHDLR